VATVVTTASFGRPHPYFYVTYLPKKLGGGTYYMTGIKDSAGELLNGTDMYKLHVPADTPAEEFWSVIVYSMKKRFYCWCVRNRACDSRHGEHGG
jgi:hypothetical protein